MNALALYGRYVAASIRAQMQYPTSFMLLTLSAFVTTGTEIVGVWALFARFGTIQGWRFGEIAVFYGLVNVTFAFADAVTRGFDVFGPEFVKTGAFDRLLVRPRLTALQLMGHELRLTRIGRLVQGAIIFTAGVIAVHLRWTLGDVLLLLAAVAGGTALFSGLLVLQATLAFWTVESLEIANVLTYGGVEAAQYPISVYATWFRDLLIYVVPIGCVAYFPVVAVLGHVDPLGAPAWAQAAAPLAGFAFFGVAIWAWGFGVRHYTSTGS
jgi:ABC-2 type transport system permease protein